MQADRRRQRKETTEGGKSLRGKIRDEGNEKEEIEREHDISRWRVGK